MAAVYLFIYLLICPHHLNGGSIDLEGFVLGNIRTDVSSAVFLSSPVLRGGSCSAGSFVLVPKAEGGGGAEAVHFPFSDCHLLPSE